MITQLAMVVVVGVKVRLEVQGAEVVFAFVSSLRC
jgi:hypothetical protein